MNKRGQNIVEYILLVAVVTMVFILFLRHQKDGKGPMENALTNSLWAINASVGSLDKEIGLGRTPVPLHNKPI